MYDHKLFVDTICRLVWRNQLTSRFLLDFILFFLFLLFLFIFLYSYIYSIFLFVNVCFWRKKKKNKQRKNGTYYIMFKMEYSM